MVVTLLHNTPLWVCAQAIRTAWASHGKSDTFIQDTCPGCGGDKLHLAGNNNANKYCCDDCNICFIHAKKVKVAGEADKNLIYRVGNKFKHGSTLEHLVYTFDITGFSRAVLQELSRHRLTSPTVKSTRYTLAELKEEEPFGGLSITDDFYAKVKEGGLESTETYIRASKYIKFTGVYEIDWTLIQQLENLRYLVALKKGKDNDRVKYSLPECYLTQEVLTINARSLQNLLSLRSDKSALWEIRELAYKLYQAIPDDHKYLFIDFMKGEKYGKEDM